MQPIKIVHFADVHLGMENYGKFDPKTGLNSRLDDFLKSLDAIVNYTIEKKVDLAIFAGDAYKTRDPSPTYQREFAKRIYKLARSNIPIAMAVGNHDFPNALGKADTLEIFPTLAVPNIYIFQKPELKIIKTASGPIQVAGVPWLSRSQMLSKEEMVRGTAEEINQKAAGKITKEIEYLSAKVNPKMPAVMIIHGTVEGAVYGSERQVMIGSEIVLPISVFRHSNFDYIALGHLHKFQEILKNPPVVYSGSIERVDFGEEKEAKGFIEAEIKKVDLGFKTKINFVSLPTRPMVSIKIKIQENDHDPTHKIIQAIKKEKIAKAIVKIVIETPENKLAEIREVPIREALEKADFIANIIKEVQKEERSQIHEGYSDELLNLDKIGILEKYFLSKKVKKLHLQKLKKEAEKLLEEDQ